MLLNEIKNLKVGKFYMKTKNIFITAEKINKYIAYLKNEEHADNTVEKYARDVRTFADFLNGEAVTKELAVAWKNKLKETHAITSINSMIAAINGFFDLFKIDIQVKQFKIQRKTFLSDEKELTKIEYERLLETAKSQGNIRLYYIMQTLCATGMRVSELRFITAEAVRRGQVEVTNKNKTRTIFIPDKLKNALLRYAKQRNINTGPIFVTRTGKEINRSNIWVEMKKLCAEAKVDSCKVFPHNLRGLFSRKFYSVEKDLAKLATILGHSNIDTTRIYIMESSTKYRRIIENLNLTRLRYT